MIITTIKIGYEFKKVEYFEGLIDIPAEIFNKGEDAVKQFIRDNSYCMDSNSEEFEDCNAGQGCSFCSNEITHTDQIAMMEEFNGYMSIMCDECIKEGGQDE